MLCPAEVRAMNKDYLKTLADKAVVTAAEGALLAIGGDSLSANAFTIDWSTVGGYALGGAVLSLLINVTRGGLFGRKQ